MSLLFGPYYAIIFSDLSKNLAFLGRLTTSWYSASCFVTFLFLGTKVGHFPQK